MKTYSKLAVAMMVGYCLLQGGQALAGVYTADYSDNASYFPTYDPTATSNPSQNAQDEIGPANPALTGLTVVWDDDGMLVSITVHSSGAASSDNGFLGFNSLFINTDLGRGDSNPEGWDYFVHDGGTANAAGYVAGTLPGDGLWEVADNYQYTTVSSTDGRTDHPNGIDASSLSNQQTIRVTYAGSAGDYTETYNFIGLDIQLFDMSDPNNPQANFVIGYTPYCANDVIYQVGKASDGVYSGGGGPTVPEPVTMVLFGAGLASLAGWRSRRKSSEK